MRKHGLSIVAFSFFLLALAGQSFAGHHSYNSEQRDHGQPEASYREYLLKGHFGEAVFENWESEFLQMAMFIFLTSILVQKGSAESRKPKGENGAGKEGITEDPRRHRADPGAPWPVRRGGPVLHIYEHSLSLSLFVLFALSFLLHGTGTSRWMPECGAARTPGSPMCPV